MSEIRGTIVAACALALAGCAQTGINGKAVGADGTATRFDPRQIAKNDIDRVADAYRREIFGSLRVLAEKLYRRNPRELKKSGHPTIEVALERLTDPRTGWRIAALGKVQNTEAILLSMREEYSGDRVAAYVSGMGGMLNAAFDDKTEFFVLDDIDPQKLYNSARNIEIAAWKLANARDSSGTPLLLSNEMGAPLQVANLSFEREFGKLIGHLDLLARIIADKENRTLSRIAQSLATAVFLPVVALR